MAFTGSVATGRAVNLAAAKNLRPATMELGGKGPIIVFSDVDVDKAVEWVAVCHSFRIHQVPSWPLRVTASRFPVRRVYAQGQ